MKHHIWLRLPAADSVKHLSSKMSVSARVGDLLISAAKLLSADVRPKTNAIVLAAARPDRAKFVAPTAKVDPSAVLGINSSVWFNSRVSAGSKIGNGTCILDGAKVEENCTLGELCVIKPGATIKNGAVLGARVVVGTGAVIPESSSVKDNTVLADGWNGKSVTESTLNPSLAEEEALHVYQQAAQHQTSWSKPLEEREAALEAFLNEKRNPTHGEKWEDYVSINPNPNKHPERRGLIYDK